MKAVTQRIILFCFVAVLSATFFCLEAVEKEKKSLANKPAIRGYDYIEWYVGSAKMVAFWHAKALGFSIVGYCGPETGVREKVSYYLVKNDLKLVISSALTPENHEIGDFVRKHGDGIKRFAYEVDDVQACYSYVVEHGGVPIQPPHLLKGEGGSVAKAAIKLYDDTEIVLVNRDRYRGIFEPRFEAPIGEFMLSSKETNLHHIDHIVGNVRINEMRKWADYLNEAFDFQTFIDFGPGDIETQYSALLSTVVKSRDNRIKHPINETFSGLKKSQIEEYLEEYHGSGVQHIAITTPNIIETITAMRENGVEFLATPKSYYDGLRERNLPILESIDDLERLGILCDFEGEGYLLQIFTKPVGDRPTFFYEVIERKYGAEGFGKGNFQALFESIEKEQELRGNLTPVELAEEEEVQQIFWNIKR